MKFIRRVSTSCSSWSHRIQYHLIVWHNVRAVISSRLRFYTVLSNPRDLPYSRLGTAYCIVNVLLSLHSPLHRTVPFIHSLGFVWMLYSFHLSSSLSVQCYIVTKLAVAGLIFKTTSQPAQCTADWKPPRHRLNLYGSLLMSSGNVNHWPKST